MKPWHSMFREADGSVSCSRVVLIFAAMVILGVWAGKSIAADHLMDIPSGVIWTFGICAGVKVGRQFGESDAKVESIKD